MMNQAVLVGRIVREPEIRENENGINMCNLTLAVPRCFKNQLGEYDTDFVDVVLWNSVAESTKEYCKKGDLIGVKGRIQTNTKSDENGDKKYYMNIVAEKVSFLQSNRSSDERINEKQEAR